MKKKKLLKTCSIMLVLALLMSTILSAFADTTNTTSSETWVAKASMANIRQSFKAIVLGGKVFALGGKNTSSLTAVEEYDPTTNLWTTKKSMSFKRSAFQAVVVNNKIYVMGGYGENPLSSVEEYDPVIDTWETKAPMATARANFEVEVIDGKIYAIGGNAESPLSSVEMYDPENDKWSSKASMPTPRFEFQMEVVDGKIYAMGGDNNNGKVSSVEMYDPENDKWSSKASMSTPRRTFQSEQVNGKIYAIGGNCGNSIITNSIEEYNPSTDTWETKTPMKIRRYIYQTVTVENKIYAIGASEVSSGLGSTSVEQYDPTTNEWITIPAMITGRYNFQAEVINGKIYAIGGVTKSGWLSSVEAYTAEKPTQSPTLTVTPSSDKVKVGREFTTTVAIHKGTNICAEDIKLTYDTNLFDYVGAEAKTGLKIQKEDSTTTPGTIRFIVSCLGKDNAATGDKDLITLKFKAKKPGQGKVDITKGRIADNATLEMDVADADCGEATITVESNKDVNRSGDVSLLDLGIDGWYYGSDAKDTDSTKYDADVMPNGKIDDDDLSEITQGIISNSKYPNN